MLKSVDYSNVITIIKNLDEVNGVNSAMIANALTTLSNSLNFDLVPHRRFNLNKAKEIVKAAVSNSPFRKEGVVYNHNTFDAVVARNQIMLYFGWTAASCNFCNVQLYTEIRNLQN